MTEEMTSNENAVTCHFCGAVEGELHKSIYCDDEVCPFCGQLGGAACDCCYEQLGWDLGTIPTELEDIAVKQWEQHCEKKGRIPFIDYPQMCMKCGKLSPEMFHVSTEEWEHYIQPDRRGEIICFTCFLSIKQLVEGTNKVISKTTFFLDFGSRMTDLYTLEEADNLFPGISKSELISLFSRKVIKAEKEKGAWMVSKESMHDWVRLVEGEPAVPSEEERILRLKRERAAWIEARKQTVSA